MLHEITDDQATQLLGQINRIVPRTMPRHDREDMVQDSVLRTLQRLHQHDAARSSLSTYVNCITCSTMKDAHRYKAAVKRRAAPSDPRACQDDPPVDQIGSEQHHVALGRSRRSDQVLAELSNDVGNVISTLPLELQAFCHELADGATVADAAKRTGIARGTAHRRMKKLRRLFEDRGLTAYIE